jgi:hypothetical protein
LIVIILPTLYRPRRLIRRARLAALDLLRDERGGVPYFTQVLASQKAVGTLFNTYTAAKSVINVTELVPIPGNYMGVGTKFRIRWWGGLSNIVTTPGTVTFQIMMGSIVVWTSGAIQMSTSSNVLQPVEGEVIIRLDSAGAGTAAKFIGGGKLVGISPQLGAGTTNPTVTDSVISIPAGAPAVGTGFDSTISDILDFWVGFSISQATNGIQLYDYTVEQIAA